MSRRSVLSATEQASLLALPEIQDDLIRYYTFNESDLALIRQRRGGVECAGCHWVIRNMNNDNTRKVPIDAPTAFIKPRWKSLVLVNEGLDRRFYETCALTELKNVLRSGHIWYRALGNSATLTNTCCHPRSSRRSSRQRHYRPPSIRIATNTCMTDCINLNSN